MISFSGQTILLDIEGTTSSVSFVTDTLFLYARKELEAFLKSYWDSQQLAQALEYMARDQALSSFHDWRRSVGRDEPDFEADKAMVVAEVDRLMEEDAKATGLKALQGLIWMEGYEQGKLKSHVYADVPRALARWRDAGVDLRIYSSGSVEAQKAFFAHTVEGDLLDFFSGHYDTTIGSKKSAESYQKIAADIGVPPDEILFLSDILAELEAAEVAGFRTGLSIRPGNAPLAVPHNHPVIRDFSEVTIEK